MTDRLSINVNNGQSKVFEAFTVSRKGGTVKESGLVGITNITREDHQRPIVPETVFNVQSSLESNIRFSSHGVARSNIELLANGNVRASGLHISYNPSLDNSDLNSVYGGGAADLPVIDFSHIEPSGTEGSEFGFLSVTEQGKIGIGLTKTRHLSNEVRSFVITDPLTISNGNHGMAGNSGTISIRSQCINPGTNANFGKIFVKPFDGGSFQTDMPYFLDGGGNLFSLVSSKLNPESVYHDGFGNTFAGEHTPKDRQIGSHFPTTEAKRDNTFFGEGAGHTADTATATRYNTFIGSNAGSGIGKGDLSASNNTVIGAKSFNNAQGGNNIVIGFRSLSDIDLPPDESPESYNGYIIIGNDIRTPEASLQIGKFIYANGGTPESSTVFTKGRIGVKDSNLHTLIDHSNRGTRNISRIVSKNFVASLTNPDILTVDFENSIGRSQTLIELDPSGTIPNGSPTFVPPAFHTPFMGVSGDIRIVGGIRFSDGTFMNTNPIIGQANLGGSGISRTQSLQTYSFHLDFTSLKEATTYKDPIDVNNAFLALQVNDDTSIDKMSKIKMQDLAGYLGSNQAMFQTNCNAYFTNNNNAIDKDKNKNSVFIGCDVAAGATGWKGSVIIGNEAGYGATIPNVDLNTDTAAVYLGYRAAYQAINCDNSVFIGSNAGRDADSSEHSIFIGASAGEFANNPNSIGIGRFALHGESSVDEQGSNNIEIVAGLSDSQRLLYQKSTMSNRLNIQNTIAADTKTSTVSIGDARLSSSSTETKPLDAVLEVRWHDNVGSDLDHRHTNYVQSWHANDVHVGAVTASGHLVTNVKGWNETSASPDCWFGNLEGVIQGTIAAPSDHTSSNTGSMKVFKVDQSTGTRTLLNDTVTVVNRNPSMSLAANDIVITAVINGEHRPVLKLGTYT